MPLEVDEAFGCLRSGGIVGAQPHHESRANKRGSTEATPAAPLQLSGTEELGGSLRARRAARRNPAVCLRLQERHAAPRVSRKANAPGKTVLTLPPPKRLTSYSQQ